MTFILPWKIFQKAVHRIKFKSGVYMISQSIQLIEKSPVSLMIWGYRTLLTIYLTANNADNLSIFLRFNSIVG